MVQAVLGEGRKRLCTPPSPLTTPGPRAGGAELGQNHGGQITCELPSATSGTQAFCVSKSTLRLEKEGPRNSSLTLPFGGKWAGISFPTSCPHSSSGSGLLQKNCCV